MHTTFRLSFRHHWLHFNTELVARFGFTNTWSKNGIPVTYPRLDTAMFYIPRLVYSIPNIGSHLGSDPSAKEGKPIAGSSVPFGTTFIDQQHGNYIGRGGGERTSIHGPLVIALAEMDFTSVSTDLWYGQHIEPSRSQKGCSLWKQPSLQKQRGHKDQSFIDQHPRDRPQDHRISAGHKKGSYHVLLLASTSKYLIRLYL